MEDDTIWDSGAYQFLITNLSNSASPNDSKLKLTILYILDSFFKVLARDQGVLFGFFGLCQETPVLAFLVPVPTGPFGLVEAEASLLKIPILTFLLSEKGESYVNSPLLF